MRARLQQRSLICIVSARTFRRNAPFRAGTHRWNTGLIIVASTRRFAFANSSDASFEIYVITAPRYRSGRASPATRSSRSPDY